MITITVKNVYSKIDGLSDMTAIDAISKALTYTLDAAKYTFQFRVGAWDGSYRLLHKNLQFATGLLDVVEGVLHARGIPYQIDDLREFIDYAPMRSSWRGHKLHDYQESIVDKALSAKTGMIQAATGAGKAQPLDSPILTPYGWVTMGDIKIGDKVCTPVGTIATVTSIHPQGLKDIYKITFSDNTFTECCDDHLWFTQTANDRSHKRAGSVKTTNQIRNSLLCFKDNRKNHSIPITEPVVFENAAHLTLDPYLLGVLLGDGSFRNCVQLTTADDEIIANISNEILSNDCNLKKVGKYHWNITGNKNNKRKFKNIIKNKIIDLGLWGLLSCDKFIPQKYLLSSIEDRLELLRGLLDTDGTISSRGTEITYCTTSFKLANDIKFLVQGLGGTATIGSKLPRYKYKNKMCPGKTAYILYLVLPNSIVPFKLSRKLSRFKKRIKYYPRRYITNIELIGKKVAQCITIDDNKHLYLTNDCIVTHNSVVIGRLIHEYNLPTVIYVVSLDLLSQMHNDLNKWLNIPIGIVGDGKCDIQQVTVCSAWTVGKAFLKDKKNKEVLEEDVEEDKWDPSANQLKMIKTMAEDAKLVILDEAQFAAASSIRAILENSKGAAYKFGFSGTPWRTGGDDLLLEAAFGKKIVKLSASELIDKGYLVQPKIMFRDIPIYDTPLPKKWKAVHSSYIVNNFKRNDLLVRNTMKLLEMGRKPLMLFREHKHGEILLNMIPPDVRVKYVTGKLSKEERDEIRDSFKAGEVDLIIASTVYDQGVDLPALDALVLAGGGKSTAKALQRIGRVIRSYHEGNKKDAIIVETFDQAHYVRVHSMARYGIYKTEPRFLIKHGDEMGGVLAKSSKWS